nr:hypothetical protein [uncultured Bacteroides sp.]
MSNSIYLPGIVPLGDVKRYNTSQAATNFSRNIISTGYFSKILSIPPVYVDSTFKSHYEQDTGIQYYAHRRSTRHLVGKILDNIYENLWLVKTISSARENNIWYYNIDEIGAISFELLRIFTHKKVFILLADFNPNSNKGIRGKIFMHCIKKADGVLSLSARCMGLNKNQINIPGIIKAEKLNGVIDKFHGNKTFLLSGCLNNNNGLELAMSAFKDIPEATLYLSGSISKDMEPVVREYTSKYSNIIYKGFFEKYEDYLDLFHATDFILSLSDLSQPVNQYNFPSKILEALSYGKVVVSAYEFAELDGVNYIKCSYTVDSLNGCVSSLISGDREGEICQCKNNKDILFEKFTELTWIRAFMALESK